MQHYISQYIHQHNISSLQAREPFKVNILYNFQGSSTTVFSCSKLEVHPGEIVRIIDVLQWIEITNQSSKIMQIHIRFFHFHRICAE